MRTSVVLPAPFGPSRPCIVPVGNVEVDAVERTRLAERDSDTRDLDRLYGSIHRTDRGSRACRGGGLATVTCDGYGDRVARTWLSVTVELVEGAGYRFWPRPGRVFAVARTHRSSSSRLRSTCRSGAGISVSCGSSSSPAHVYVGTRGPRVAERGERQDARWQLAAQPAHAVGDEFVYRVRPERLVAAHLPCRRGRGSIRSRRSATARRSRPPTTAGASCPTSTCVASQATTARRPKPVRPAQPRPAAVASLVGRRRSCRYQGAGGHPSGVGELAALQDGRARRPRGGDWRRAPSRARPRRGAARSREPTAPASTRRRASAARNALARRGDPRRAPAGTPAGPLVHGAPQRRRDAARTDLAVDAPCPETAVPAGGLLAATARAARCDRRDAAGQPRPRSPVVTTGLRATVAFAIGLPPRSHW